MRKVTIGLTVLFLLAACSQAPRTVEGPEPLLSAQSSEYINTVEGLRAALADPLTSEVILEAGHYLLGGTPLEIIEKDMRITAAPGLRTDQVVLDGEGQSRVITIRTEVYTHLPVDMEVEIEGVTIRGGFADGVDFSSNPEEGSPAAAGGGVFMHQGSLLVVRDTVFEDNRAYGRGGGLASWAAGARVEVHDSWFRRNSAALHVDWDGYGGGAISVLSAPAGFLATGSTFSSNRAPHGSALYLQLDHAGGSCSSPRNYLINSTIVDNGVSAAVHISGGSLGILFSTISGNDAGALDAYPLGSSCAALSHSIAAANGDTDIQLDPGLSVHDHGFNLIGVRDPADGSQWTVTNPEWTSQFIGTDDPGLMAPADFGASGPVMPPQPWSAAAAGGVGVPDWDNYFTELDLPANLVPYALSDQRGVTRQLPGLAEVDIGAVQTDLISGWCPAGDLHVNGLVNPAGTGASWASALRHLDAAVEIARICPDVERILLAAGTYGAPVSSFLLDFGIEIRGGHSEDGLNRDPELFPTILSGNSSTRVFEVADNAYVTLSGVNIASGRAPDGQDGGGILISSGDATLRDVHLYDNFARRGGAIAATGGTFQISASRFSDNQASQQGGAIFRSSTSASTVNAALFDGNSAAEGSSLYLQGVPGSCQLFTATAISNSTFTAGAGSAAIHSQSGGVILLFSTVTGNPEGGVVSGSSGECITVGHSIVSGNGEHDFLDSSGSGISSAGYNLVGPSFGSLEASSAVVNDVADLELSPLQDNGGRWPSLQPGDLSPALAGGVAAADWDAYFEQFVGGPFAYLRTTAGTDQRGADHPRPLGHRSGVGAIEELVEQQVSLSVNSTPIHEHQPLVVTVTAAAGDQVPRGLIIISGPGDDCSATLAGGVAACELQLPAGVHELLVEYLPSLVVFAPAATVAQVSVLPQGAPLIAISADSFTALTPAELVISVNAPGSVAVFRGTELLTSGPLVDGALSLPVDWPAGAYMLAVQFSSADPAVMDHVQRFAVQVSPASGELTLELPPVTVGAPLLLRAAGQGLDGAEVSFSISGTVVGSAVFEGGSAELLLQEPGLAAGSHLVTAATSGLAEVLPLTASALLTVTPARAALALALLSDAEVGMGLAGGEFMELSLTVPDDSDAVVVSGFALTAAEVADLELQQLGQIEVRYGDAVMGQGSVVSGGTLQVALHEPLILAPGDTVSVVLSARPATAVVAVGALLMLAGLFRFRRRMRAVAAAALLALLVACGSTVEAPPAAEFSGSVQVRLSGVSATSVTSGLPVEVTGAPLSVRVVAVEE